MAIKKCMRKGFAISDIFSSLAQVILITQLGSLSLLNVIKDRTAWYKESFFYISYPYSFCYYDCRSKCIKGLKGAVYYKSVTSKLSCCVTIICQCNTSHSGSVTFGDQCIQHSSELVKICTHLNSLLVYYGSVSCGLQYHCDHIFFLRPQQLDGTLQNSKDSTLKKKL